MIKGSISSKKNDTIVTARDMISEKENSRLTYELDWLTIDRFNRQPILSSK